MQLPLAGLDPEVDKIMTSVLQCKHCRAEYRFFYRNKRSMKLLARQHKKHPQEYAYKNRKKA